MKLQGLGIVFALIALPVILILSYYIQSQVSTIALQTSYDTKLLDATHDAMSAFELNTANEDLSSVADSLRSIIDASNNIFINTLATNLGMSNASKSYVQPYVPAMLYTLYDGYYIYAPTKTPTVLANSSGVAVTVGDLGVEIATSYVYKGKTYIIYKYDEEKAKTTETDSEKNTRISSLYNYLGNNAEDFGQILYKNKGGTYSTILINDTNSDYDTYYKIDYVLKSYIPYSARYGNDAGTKNVNINYTLDNYLTITGTVDGVYYAKSGYLIDKSLIDSMTIEIEIDGNIYSGGVLETYNEAVAEEACLSGDYKITIKFDGVEITTDRYNVSALETELKNTTKGSIRANEIQCQLESAYTIAYYVRSYVFSNWVYNNLSDIKESNIQEDISNEMKDLYKSTSGADSIIYEFSSKNNVVFNKNENPEEETSTFYVHKREVIKNSIQYNLNLAMSSYNTMSQNSYSFNMPVISENEWEQIIDNVSIVSFMQGFKCGLKTYNNYAVVSSTNNELTIIPEEIYYVKNYVDENGVNRGLNDESSTYHRIDCPELLSDSEESNDSNFVISSFTSKEVKYDKIYSSTEGYLYDHKNLACYNCIIGSNYETKTGRICNRYRY